MDDLELKDKDQHFKELVEAFHQSKSQESLVELLTFIANSELYIVVTGIHSNDKLNGLIDQYNEVDNDQVLEIQDAFLTIESDNNELLVVYSSEDECDLNQDEYGLVRLRMIDIIKFASSVDVSGLVIDPETNNFYMNKNGFEDVLSLYEQTSLDKKLS